MTLGELIDNLVAIRDGVLGVDNSTLVQFVEDDSYTATIEGIRLISDPRVEYGTVRLETTLQILGVQT